jgi:hypothetical protein
MDRTTIEKNLKVSQDLLLWKALERVSDDNISSIKVRNFMNVILTFALMCFVLSFVLLEKDYETGYANIFVLSRRMSLVILLVGLWLKGFLKWVETKVGLDLASYIETIACNDDFEQIMEASEENARLLAAIKDTDKEMFKVVSTYINDVLLSLEVFEQKRLLQFCFKNTTKAYWLFELNKL